MNMSHKGRALSISEKQMVVHVKHYFDKEKELFLTNKKLDVNNSAFRTALATNLSQVTVWRIMAEYNNNNSFSLPAKNIRRDLSGSGLLTIVCKRFLIRELEDRFESQSRASRSGIALGVSPSGVSPQVVDHRLESATIPRPIAIAKGAKQLREGVGGGH